MMLQGNGGREFTVVTTQPGGVVTTQTLGGTPLGSPQQIYRALQSQRQVLGEQLRNAQNQRSSLLEQLSNGRQTPATIAGIEKRIATVDERIASLDKQIVASDAQVAQAAAIPGATFVPPPQPRNGPPEEVFVLGGIFMFVVLLPLTIAYARRIWRRSAKTEVTLPPQMAQRMESIEQGVEAIALEVERIGESQRFLTQAMAERIEVRAIADGQGERKAERAEVRR
jgi:hypothetical protein